MRFRRYDKIKMKERKKESKQATKKVNKKNLTTANYDYLVLRPIDNAKSQLQRPWQLTQRENNIFILHARGKISVYHQEAHSWDKLRVRWCHLIVLQGSCNLVLLALSLLLLRNDQISDNHDLALG